MGKKSRMFFALIFVLAVSIRLLYSFHPAPESPAGGYLATADAVTKGAYLFADRGEFLDLYRTPVYPVFLSIIMRFADSVRPVGPVQRVIGLLTALLVFFISLRIWKNVPAALLAMAFCGLHFHFLLYESYALSDTLTGFLCHGALLVLIYLIQKPDAPSAFQALGGLLAALAALCRPEFALMGIAAPFFLWSKAGPAAKKIPVFVLTFTLVVGAWILRNGLLMNYWRLTPNVPVAFFEGPGNKFIDWNNEKPDFIRSIANNYGFRESGHPMVFMLQNYGVAYSYSGPEIGRLAMHAVKNNFSEYLKASAKNLLGRLTETYWPLRKDMLESNPVLFRPEFTGRHPQISRLIYLQGMIENTLEPFTLIPLFIAGVIIALFKKPRSREIWLLVLISAFILFVHSFIGPGGIRYRTLVEPVMGMFAAYAVIRLISGFMRRIRPQSAVVDKSVETGLPISPLIAERIAAAAVIASGLGWLWFTWELSHAYYAKWQREYSATAGLARNAKGSMKSGPIWTQLGFEYLRQNLPAKALSAFNKALAGNPADSRALAGRGTAYFLMAEGGPALKYLEESLLLDQSDPDVNYYAGIIYGLTDGGRKAVVSLTRFLESKPAENGKTINALAMRADCLLAQGRKGEAMRDYKNAVKLAPEWHNKKAEIRELLGRLSNQ
ncbi:MAG: glycosyltransferase family 39 protein [Elusimicrobia bacterium]|nr:glycosyltransferase family 39 protein [Elusimicrobiota bacterium]